MKIPRDEGFHRPRRVREHHGSNLDRWSYMEVVKGNGKLKVERTVEREEERIKKIERLVLKGSQFNMEWLERSAIGVLKNFASIAKCWDEVLLKRLGRLLGELVLVEEDMLRKKRLDSGRLLVLLPVDRSCP
ncbi:hypothetical protein Q3G72_029520 [Acer saccharum]|nr:hypothetical protein Q3G72_029520 [Acer saccharum]